MRKIKGEYSHRRIIRTNISTLDKRIAELMMALKKKLLLKYPPYHYNHTKIFNVYYELHNALSYTNIENNPNGEIPNMVIFTINEKDRSKIEKILVENRVVFVWTGAKGQFVEFMVERKNKNKVLDVLDKNGISSSFRFSYGDKQHFNNF